MLVVAGAGLAVAPSAGAASYTWTGEASSTPKWSSATNWGGVAPTGGSTVELDFPHLTRATCTESAPTQACYESENDLAGVTVESMRLDDGDVYELWGHQIGLGSGGLIASPASGSSGPAGDFVELPIELTAQQSWSVVNRAGGRIGENGVFLLGFLSGAHPLTVNISDGAAMYMATSAEVGALTIAGANTSGAGVFNGFAALLEGQLNSTDGNPVDISHIFFIADGSTGPLVSTSAELDIGSGYPAGSLDVGSAAFDANSEVEFKVSGSGDVAGHDYSQLASSGAVQLGGAHLSLRVIPPSEKQTCPSLSPGTQYTLVSTTGGLSGEFANAPEGGEIPIGFASKCTQVSQFLKIAYNRTGPTQTVVGTVIAGPSSSTALSASPGTPSTNQTVTLTATVTASVGVPIGTVEFRDGGSAIPGCASQPTGATGASYAASCRTSFAASSSPEQLSAAFAPASGVNLKASASAGYQLSIGKGATATALAGSAASAQTGSSVTYTATVSPVDAGAAHPSGSVEYLDGGVPIASCTSQPLSASGTATCQLSYGAAGTHSITARYTGDARFEPSASPAQTLAVEAVVPPVVLPSDAWLISASITVQSNGWTAVKIGCEGIEACHGKLVLQVRQAAAKRRRHAKASHLVTIGEASFSVAGSTTANVAVPIDGLGARLLKAHHGRLAVRLVIAQAKPSPTKTATVRLVQRTSRRRHKHTK